MLYKLYKQISFAALFVLTFLGGCTPDHAGGGKYRHVTAQSVTHFDQVLDKKATPQQVAYVLLRGIHDDAIAKSRADRDKAIDTLFDLAAADIIRTRNPTGLGPDEYVDKVVRNWTPTISYYAKDLPTDWASAQHQLIQTTPHDSDLGTGPTTECEILIELADPSGDHNAQVLAYIWMAKDQGFWRVIHLGYKNNVRSVDELRALAVAARTATPPKGN